MRAKKEIQEVRLAMFVVNGKEVAGLGTANFTGPFVREVFPGKAPKELARLTHHGAVENRPSG
ncbi:MAG: hypothetical protein HYV04_01575 [Deltaproteobacteria bacterium]|nr:hypothetical protein [Deltaproteobacteria bacterium]